MSDKDFSQPQWKCTVCGRIGTVGRCCGLKTREPLNLAARTEYLAELIAANTKPASAGEG
jgi:hypothetical protein